MNIQYIFFQKKSEKEKNINLDKIAYFFSMKRTIFLTTVAERK